MLMYLYVLPTGFVPTSYSSSRTARAESRKSRPEDYMDEQDLSKHYRYGNVTMMMTTLVLLQLQASNTALMVNRTHQQRDSYLEWYKRSKMISVCTY